MSGFRGFALGLLALGMVPPAPCPAQLGPFAGPDPIRSPAQDSLVATVAAQVPPQGDWAEVVTIKDQWLVLQNGKGQQFPVSLAGVNLFVIRWPTDLGDVPPDALVDIYGFDVGSNQMQTDHVDVYEDATAHVMNIRPTYESLARLGMLANNFVIQKNLQINQFQPLEGPASGPVVANGQPSWMHVVGSIVGLNPLQVMTPGFIVVTVLPQANGMTATLVTPGSSSFVRKGDLAYFIPSEPTPKSLNLAQLVIYKKVPPNAR